MDKEAIGVSYNTRIKFYEIFKVCQDQDVRTELFSKLNQNVLRGEAEGNKRRKLAEAFNNLHTDGKNYIQDLNKTQRITKKRNQKLNPKKLPFKNYFDSKLEEKDYLPTPDEIKSLIN